MDKDTEKKIIDITFNSSPKSFNSGWGWRIPHNPNRTPGEMTEAERQVKERAREGVQQTRGVTTQVTYTYEAPFSYPNIHVELGRPGTGVEFNPDGAEIDIYPYGCIIIEEEDPITAVSIIGSGCSTNSYVILEAEPIEWKYPRTSVRMMKSDLWGCHVRGDAWKRGTVEDWNDAGMSSARFDIPESKKVILGGGSHGADPHYCFRIIRIEVSKPVL